MMKKRISFAVLILALVYSSCAPSRYVRPLGKKQQAVTANFGGPMIGFAGTVIPVPLTSFGYGYGLDSLTTVYGNLHTTSLLYGVFQTDIGLCREFYHAPCGLGLSGNLSGNFTFDRWEHQFRAWPELDLNVYKTYNSRGSFVYAGADTWFELSRFRAHQQPQNVHVIFNPHLGIQFVKTKWNFQLEGKFIAPNISSLPNVVDYKGIGGHGAIGIYFGVYRLF